jgi:hypothetical protein
MAELPEPIKSVLRDYCHVEWYEVDELAGDVQSECQKFDVTKLKEQFESLIASSEDYSLQINQLTSNEFESEDDVKIWLRDIYKIIFL